VVASVAGERVTWQHRLWRRQGFGLIVVALGGLAGLLVAGGLLSIDNTANAKHLDTAQDLIGVVALTLGVIVVTIGGVAGVHIMRRPIVAVTDGTVSVFRRRRVTIPRSMVDCVSIAPKDPRSKRRAVSLLTKTGVNLPVRDTRSRADLGDVAHLSGVINGASISGPRFYRFARDLEAHISAGTSLKVSENARENGSSTVGVRRTVGLPQDTRVRRTSREQGGARTRRAIRAMVTTALLFSVLGLATAQQGSGHPFQISQFLVGVAVVVVVLGVLVGGGFLTTAAEVAVGETWVAKRLHGRRRWRLLERDEAVGVVPRDKRGGLWIGDQSGHAVSLGPGSLDKGIGTALFTVFKDSMALSGGAATTLRESVSDSGEDEHLGLGPVEVVTKEQLQPLAPRSPGFGDQPIKYGSLHPAVILTVGCASYTIFALLLLILGTIQSHAAPAVTGVVLLALTTFIWRVVPNAYRRVELQRDVLIVPQAPGRVERVPISGIAGMGLSRIGASGRGAWALTVWTTHNEIIRTNRIAVARAVGESLGSASAGSITRELFSRVAALQGPLGPLTMRALQRSVHQTEKVRFSSVWDPSTGEIRRQSGVSSGAGP
jgi:hypothetical protein